MPTNAILDAVTEIELTNSVNTAQRNENPYCAFPSNASIDASAGFSGTDLKRLARIWTGGPKAASAVLPTWRRGKMLTLASVLVMLAAVGAKAQVTTFTAPQNVGTTAPAQSITVTATATGTVSTVKVLTLGASGLEYVKGSGISTCDNSPLTIGATCTESVSFTPTYPGLRLGAVELLDASSNVLGTTYISGVGQGGLDVLTPGNMVTVAGQFKKPGSTGDGKAATGATINEPAGIVLDGAGNMYIADSGNNKIRIICGGTNSATIAGTTCPTAGDIYTLAGTGSGTFSGDGGPASKSTLNAPKGVALDGAGNLYIADSGNNRIRKISAATGIITTVAGNGDPGFGGDTELATSPDTELNLPQGVTIDLKGNIYIADTSNQRIRKVDAVTGIITTAVGNGDASGLGDGKGTFTDDATALVAGLSLPYTVAFDVKGDMLIPDSANNRIRLVTADLSGNITAASKVTTVAGSGVVPTQNDTLCPTGVSTSVNLNSPSGVAVDAATNLYIADSYNFCIRKANATSGIMTTIGKSGAYALTLSGTVVQETVFAPVGIAVDGLGNVYASDYFFMLIDKIQSNVAFLDYLPTPVLKGELSATSLPEIIENDGNAAASLTPQVLTAASNAELDATDTTCVAPFPFGLTQDADCTIQAYFAPSTTGNPLFGNIYVSGSTINDDNVNLPLDIILAGDGAQFTMTLTSTPNPSAFGASVTFTAKVSASGSTATGTVTFTDSLNGGPATAIGSPSLSGGTATLAISTLAVGVHTITATYGSNSTTATVTQTVYENTKTTLTASPVSPSTLGTPVIFTATIAGAVGGGQTLNGTVTFTDSAATFSSNVIPVTVSGVTGTASYTATNLVEGSNVITAVFTPTDTTLQTPSTGTLTQKVQAAAALTLTSSPATTTYGSPIVFTVGVPTVGTTAATGSVSVKIIPVGGTVATSTLTLALKGNPAAGTATTSTLPVGSYNVTATYPGDTNYGTGTATLGYVEVVTQVQTSTAVVATPNPAAAGNAVAIKATVTQSSGTVIPTGTLTLTDTFGGNTVTFGGGAQTLSNGAYTYNTSTLLPGTHLITATYSGSTNDATSSATTSLIVNQPSTTTTLTASPAAPLAGKPVTLTATVKASAGSASPAGTVTITDAFNGTTVTLGSGAVTLSKGIATLDLAALAAGTHKIVATYAGDTDDAGSSATLNLPVVNATTTITVTATPNPAIVNTTITFTATVKGNGVAPTGTVKFLANGTTDLGSGTVDESGTIKVTNATLAAGTYQVTAVYAGDADNATSTSEAVAEVVGVIPTATALSTASTTGANSQSILVSTVADSGVSGAVPTGTVTFMNASTKIGSATLNANGVATLTPVLGTGTYSIIANYSGDSLHGPSSSIAMPVTGTGSSFSIGITPGTITLAASQSSTMNVNLTSLGGFADTINLGCVGLPAGITCHFSAIDVALKANGTGTTQLTVDTDNPLGGGTSTSSMNKPAATNRTVMAGIFLPFSLFFGWIMWSFRKRHANVLTAVLVLVLTGAALLASGCGGFTQSSAAPGTYVIQVAGVGTNSNVTEYQTITLTVTK